jgi:nucleoside-diphosphate-sugar epimerase
MRALFIGGTGLISTAVSKLAVEKGFDLYLLNRGMRKENIPAGAKCIQADIKDLKAVSVALKDNTFDVAVNWIGFVPQDVERDIQLLKGRVGQYIYVSSASVYQKPVTHYLVTESTPLANPYWDYSQNKIACEERLMKEYRESGFPVTIVRPSLTYGDSMIFAATNSWAHPYTIINRMRKGKKVVVPGDGTSLWTMTHNTDFAKGFVGLMGNIQTIGHAFHITSDEVLNWNQIYEIIGRVAGVKPKLIHIPSDFIAAFVPEMMGSLIGDKTAGVVFDNTKIKRFVPDFVAATTVEQGFRRALAWFEADPKRCTVDEEWDLILDKIIEAYETGLKLVD